MAAGFRTLVGFWFGGFGITQTGNPSAEVRAYYVYRATPRPSMPIAYLKTVYRYLASPDPDSGEYPGSMPQNNQ